MQTDPIGYADQMNLYAYVGNDPMNMTDPSGMMSFDNCTNAGGGKYECGFSSSESDDRSQPSAQEGKVDRNVGSGFKDLDLAGIKAARAVHNVQNSLIACEPLCSSDASTAVGTVIEVETHWFSEDTYGWDRPNEWGEIGRVVNIFGNPVLSKNPAGWAVGVGRHGRQELPSQRHYSILKEIGSNAGYFAAPSGAVRKFDQSGGCATILGNPLSGC